MAGLKVWAHLELRHIKAVTPGAGIVEFSVVGSCTFNVQLITISKACQMMGTALGGRLAPRPLLFLAFENKGL